jgi:hypothetical protein
MKINSLLAVVVGCALIFILVGLSHSFATNHPERDHQLMAYNKVMKCGMNAYKLGNYSKATVLFRKAIETKPNSDKAWIFFRQSVLQELAEQGLVSPDLINASEIKRIKRQKQKPVKTAPKADILLDDDKGC